MGKSCQLPFYSSKSNVVEPLDQLHYDIWDPSPVVSVQGFEYYAVFVDEFSRYSLLFPLKSKSELCDVFIGFQKKKLRISSIGRSKYSRLMVVVSLRLLIFL